MNEQGRGCHLGEGIALQPWSGHAPEEAAPVVGAPNIQQDGRDVVSLRTDAHHLLAVLLQSTCKQLASIYKIRVDDDDDVATIDIVLAQVLAVSGPC